MSEEYKYIAGNYYGVSSYPEGPPPEEIKLRMKREQMIEREKRIFEVFLQIVNHNSQFEDHEVWTYAEAYIEEHEARVNNQISKLSSN